MTKDPPSHLFTSLLGELVQQRISLRDISITAKEQIAIFLS